MTINDYHADKPGKIKMISGGPSAYAHGLFILEQLESGRHDIGMYVRR